MITLGKNILPFLIAVIFQAFPSFLTLRAIYRKKAVFILEPASSDIHWKCCFCFIFSDVPLHFHFETLLKKTEIKGDLAENKFVGDSIITPSPGMSFTNLVFYIPFTSLIYLITFAKEIKFNKGINVNP